jgi:hypothetical protein
VIFDGLERKGYAEKPSKNYVTSMLKMLAEFNDFKPRRPSGTLIKMYSCRS